MATSLTTLIEQTRIESGLRNNRLFSDAQIARLLTDAFWALRDLMIAKFAYWFRAEYNFTLTGGNDGNVLDLATNVPDLEMIQGLFLVDASGNLRKVDLMSSIQETGNMDATYPFGGNGWSFNGFVGRRYFPDGNSLFVYPTANSAGTYRLIYTPQAQRLDLPVTRTFNIDAADTDPVSVGDLPGPGYWIFANGEFNTVQFDGSYTTDIPIDGSAYLDTNFSAGPPDNTSFNSRWFINGVSDSAANTISVTVAPSGTVTGPAAGTATLTYQPIGTISELPVNLTPWQRYLVLYASIIIRQSRRQPMGDLELQFQQIEKRISAITKQRSEGVRQAPITRGFWGRSGGSYGP